jgi:type I restriction enzyme, S subunit
MICDKVYRFRADESRIDPRFLAYTLNTPRIMDEIEFMKTGISDSGLNLTHTKFQGLVIRVAPLKEQKEIVRRVEAHFKLADVI